MKLDTYIDWKHCITVLCGITLTKNYIEERISALNDPHNYHTQQFIKTWGTTHLQKTLA